MKLLHVAALIGFFLAALPAQAQDNVALYRVADVAVDLSASSAAQARDQGLMQAQHQAFDQLLTRLNASKTLKASDDDVALMVHAFEVQKEHAAGQRYIGLFTVEFSPEAVGQFLGKKGVTYTVARAQPVVILPIFRSKDRATLWEDQTPWRSAWEEAVRKTSVVPMIVPSGDLDDIAKIGADEALSGKVERLQAIMQKYEAGGVMVAVLQADSLSEGSPIQGAIKVFAYDFEGRVRDTIDLDLAPGPGTKDLESELSQSIAHMIHTIEADWSKGRAQTEAGVQPSGLGTASAISGAPVTLPVTVPVPTLAAWATIRGKLNRLPQVSSVHVITMTRGLVHIELQFRGDLASLQSSFERQALRLEQEASGAWQLKQTNEQEGL